MSWDSTWEQVFQTHDWGRYPPEELIRFVARHFFSVADRRQVKILEVGCGPGANIWFLAREGFDVYGIDGSPTAIEKAERRLRQEGLKAHLRVGDIVSLGDFYPSSAFDAVVDVACLQHNDRQAIQIIMGQIVSVLKQNGKLFSMMLAAGSYGYGLGKEIEPGTFVDIEVGPAQGKGLHHFFRLDEVKVLLEGQFSNVQIEYSNRSLNNRRHNLKYWVAEGCK